MNYYELRRIVSKIIPRRTQLVSSDSKVNAVREKGRKSNYYQFHIKDNEWKKNERLLNTAEINSFLEISVRAAACPMPLNLDVWDGLYCPFACSYCYADAFRASLYTAFFDNSKTMGLRHCNVDYYKKELDTLMPFRGQDPKTIQNDVKKAIAMEIPMRLGIRFEDFTYIEAKKKISLKLLQYLAKIKYPVMINTKSDVVGRDEYVKALADNHSAVHMTVISADNDLLKLIEPGAPSYEKRLKAIKNLTSAGVRVVARIEPFMVFITDERKYVDKYILDMKDAGVSNITFDTYSYTAKNPGIRNTFVQKGIDYERMFMLGCDSQALGSLLLDKFMDLFRQEGISCSTFDMGCAPGNNQTICCEVGDWFSDYGFNWGCSVSAARYIISRKKHHTSWKNFCSMVEKKGGFLSPVLKNTVHELWNAEGSMSAYSSTWSAGIEPVGLDEDGIIYRYNKGSDHRQDLLNNLIV